MNERDLAASTAERKEAEKELIGLVPGLLDLLAMDDDRAAVSNRLMDRARYLLAKAAK